MLRFSSLATVRSLKSNPRSVGSALFWLCAALVLTGCPVDDRTLSVSLGSSGQQNRAGNGATGSAGAPTVAGSGDGGAPDSSAAGQAGEGGAGGADTRTFPDGCADLDQDDISDCTQTLLANSAFARDVSGWTAENGAAIVWDPRDLLAGAASGSALVTSSVQLDTNGDSFVAADQCVPVRPGAILGIFANASIDAGQVAGRVAIDLWFFGAASCPGDAPMSVYETAEAFDVGSVLKLHGSDAVPEGMSSVRVRLGVIKPSRAASFSVRFDNILVREE